MAGFRPFAVSELSLASVRIMFFIQLQRKSGTASAVPTKSSCGTEYAAGGESARPRRDFDDTICSTRRKPRPHLACRPACTRMPCCRSATPWAGLGQFAVFRWPMSSTRIDGAGLTGIKSRQSEPGCGEPPKYATCLSRQSNVHST
jgi:hypothetical protein